MKEILHLTHTSVPDDARILRELSALSATTDLKVHAFGLHERADVEVKRPFALRQFRVRSSRATWLPRPVQYALVLIEINARFAARIARMGPDVVHCHDTMVLPAGAFAKLLSRSRLIYDAHELESDKAGQSRALSRATWWIERACWPWVDALISVSPSIISWYHKNLGWKPSLCLLNSPEIARDGRADNRGDGGGARVRKCIQLADESSLFVYVGALESGRGIELLLDVFSRKAPEAHIVFVGEGTLRAGIQDASRAHSNVHHSPPVPHDELVSFIQDADAAFCLIEDVSLSDHYCLPNKLFEYAFAGLPVIASRLPDIQKMVDEYHLGTCADLDGDSIEVAMRHCINLERAIGPDESISQLTPLSWESQAENLRALYSVLLAADSGDDDHSNPSLGLVAVSRGGNQIGARLRLPAAMRRKGDQAHGVKGIATRIGLLCCAG